MATRTNDDLAAVEAWLGKGGLSKALPADDGAEAPPEEGAAEPATVEVDADEEETGPEVDFVPTVVKVYRAWKAAKAGGEFPADLPADLKPQPDEAPGLFAQRAAKALQAMPGGKEAFAAAGPEPEWTAWVTSIMRYHGEEGATEDGQPEGMEKSIAAVLLDTLTPAGWADGVLGVLTKAGPDARPRLTPKEAGDLLALTIERDARCYAAARVKATLGLTGGQADGAGVPTPLGYYGGDPDRTPEDASEDYATVTTRRLPWEDDGGMIGVMRAKGGVPAFFAWVRSEFLAAANAEIASQQGE